MFFFPPLWPVLRQHNSKYSASSYLSITPLEVLIETAEDCFVDFCVKATVKALEIQTQIYTAAEATS